LSRVNRARARRDPSPDQDAEVNRFTRLPRASANPTIRAIAVSSIKDKVAPEDPSRPSDRSGSRASGEWNEDDYDVLIDGAAFSARGPQEISAAKTGLRG
jgi:hypothetical protein